MAMFARVGRDETEDPSVGPDDRSPSAPKRLTPDGHEVAPGAIAQGFVFPWPELRVQAIYESVEPDSFRGEVLCGGTILAVTGITEFEPDAIRMAEDLVVAAVARLFDQAPA